MRVHWFITFRKCEAFPYINCGRDVSFFILKFVLIYIWQNSLLVYSSMSFGKCIESYSDHHNQIHNIYNTPLPIFPYAIPLKSNLFPPSLIPDNHRFVFPFPECNINKWNHIQPFEFGFLLSIKHLRFFYLLHVSINCLFFFTVEQFFMVWSTTVCLFSI